MHAECHPADLQARLGQHRQGMVRRVERVAYGDDAVYTMHTSSNAGAPARLVVCITGEDAPREETSEESKSESWRFCTYHPERKRGKSRMDPEDVALMQARIPPTGIVVYIHPVGHWANCIVHV